MPARRVEDKHNDLTALPPSPKRSTQPLLFLSSLLAFLVFLESSAKFVSVLHSLSKSEHRSIEIYVSTEEFVGVFHGIHLAPLIRLAPAKEQVDRSSCKGFL